MWAGSTSRIPRLPGTITVGATDTEDAQLGPDGKPLPGSQLALAAPKEPADAAPVAHMFYVAYFKTGAKAEERPDHVLLQRRTGQFDDVAAHGIAGTEVCGDGQRYASAGRAIQADRQSRLPARRERPGLYRYAGHGLWPAGRQGRRARHSGAWTRMPRRSARFIARFLAKYGRWNSPKFLFGESYGTTRSAVLADLLENEKSIDLNGVMLLGRSSTSPSRRDQPHPGIGSAVRAGPANLRGDGLVPQETFAAAGRARSVFERSGGLCHWANTRMRWRMGNALSDAEKQQVAREAARVHRAAGRLCDQGQSARDGGRVSRRHSQNEEGMTTGRYDTRFSRADHRSAE